MAKKNELKSIMDPGKDECGVSTLFEAARRPAARRPAARSVNIILTTTYWKIERRIVSSNKKERYAYNPHLSPVPSRCHSPLACMDGLQAK